MPQPDTSSKRHEDMLQRLQSELSSTVKMNNGGKNEIDNDAHDGNDNKEEERLRKLLMEYEDKCTDYGMEFFYCTNLLDTARKSSICLFRLIAEV